MQGPRYTSFDRLKSARRLIGHANAVTPLPGFTEEDLMIAWERCEGRCAVSGLEFSEVQVGGGKARRPYAPSLDRIEPRRGYEPDNVRLVCAVANFAMNAWGLEPVLHMARAMAKKHDQEVGDPDDRLWLACQDAKIPEAERQAAHLTCEAQRQARRRIAALSGCERWDRPALSGVADWCKSVVQTHLDVRL
jgi:hypothetical protein